MFNRKRTLEVFGYDIDPHKRSRRSDDDFEATKGILKKHLIVIDNCPSCGEERQIQYRNSKKNKLCLKCFHNTPKMYAIKLARKDCVFTDEHKHRLSENHWSTKGIEPAFKGQHHTKEAKTILRNKREKQFSQYTKDQIKQMNIKGSCSQQGISIEDFKGFVTPENTRIRQSAEGKAWTYDVLAKANFTCIKCSNRGGSLCGHHLNSFNSYPEQRLDPDNGVCLCNICHGEFHDLYGKGNNTKEQFEQWLHPIIKSKPTVYLLIGAPAAGKSWVASQLLDKLTYVSYDGTSKKDHINLLRTPLDKPKLYDPTFKISTIIRRHSDEFNFILVGIYEDEATLRLRVAFRGGEWTDTIMKRNEVVRARYKKYGNGGFMGTSQEVLDYLKKELTQC